jgi:acetyl esterase/lipase
MRNRTRVRGARIRPARGSAGALVAALAAVLAACADAAGTDTTALVDLDALFVPASAAEIQAVRAEWRTRDPAPTDVRVEATQAFSIGATAATLRVLSHAIPGGRHYGAVIAVDRASARALPVLLYAHGGDQGVDLTDLALLSLAIGDAASQFVWVVPSFRSETLRAGGRTFSSGGTASPWDRDVDDAITLLGAALATTPAADPERVGAIGFSRGGGVALLAAIRDRRVDRVVDFFGPTDFFGPYVREIVEETLAGRPPDLPGVAALRAQFLEPLQKGELKTADVRRELARRSAVLFAAELPPVQVHHGTADQTVAVSQAESLIAALRALGRGPPTDGFFLYPGAGHDPFALVGSLPRALVFLQPLLQK